MKCILKHDHVMILFFNRNRESLFDGNKENSFNNNKKQEDDPTQLIITLRMTQIAGVVPLIYGMLLDSQVFSKSHNEVIIPNETSKHSLIVAEICLSLLNHVALLDLQMLQSMLGSESLSLQVRHITSHLLWYCDHFKENNRNLLHEVILLLGYFTVMNSDNQSVIQSGQKPDDTSATGIPALRVLFGRIAQECPLSNPFELLLSESREQTDPWTRNVLSNVDFLHWGTNLRPEYTWCPPTQFNQKERPLKSAWLVSKFILTCIHNLLSDLVSLFFRKCFPLR